VTATVGLPALVDSVLAADRRIRPYVRETPLEPSETLAAATGSTDAAVWLKCENLQRTGSFKLRGAFNKLLTSPPAMLTRGVVTASTGNHGRAVAHALSVMGARGTIYLPTCVSAGKIETLRRYPSVTLAFHGADSGVAEVHARRVAEESGRLYVSPYNDLDVIAGQGTIGVELARQCPGLDAVFVAVGGGGLIGGIAGYLKAKRPGLRVIGCWPERAPALYAALQAGRIVDECVLVSEDEIAEAVRLMVVEHHLVIEGAAGVAVAAFRKVAARYPDKTTAIILCGGNIAPDALRTVLGG
jgi:threonine dehydratase